MDFGKNAEEKESDDLITIRNEKISKFFKKESNFIFYGLLALIVYLASFIRTRNLPGLKDVTTGDWTLGPDLDPFLFLRWAEYIVDNGKLFAMDVMRSSPLAEICTGIMCNPISTAKDGKLLSYLIAWFHDFLSVMPSFIVANLPGSPTEITINYSGVLFPVFMFILTVIDSRISP